MKLRPSKKLERLMREVNCRTEPRTADALFNIVRSVPTIGFKLILAPPDFSRLSMRGVRYAIWLATKLDAALELVHVVEPSPRFGGDEALVLADDDLQLLEFSERQLGRLSRRLTTKDQ